MPRTASVRLSSFVLVLALALPGFAGAQGSATVRSAPLAPAPAHLARIAPVAEPPARIAAAFEPLARLVEARVGAVDELEAMAARNRSDRPPLQIGFARPLPLERRVRFTGELASSPAGLHAGGGFARVGGDTTVWGAAVEVAGAHRLRLHLAEVELPAGTRMWVYGEDGEAAAFGPELAHEGGLWTPSVAGPSIRLEVELPRSALGADGQGFVVDQVGEIFRLDSSGAPMLGEVVPRAQDFSCLTDSNCVEPATFPAIDAAEKAIAAIQFFEGGFFGCSGGLLNVAAGAPAGLAPPFLTANHCFSTQGGASSLEAFWDFRTESCNGAAPEPDSLPRSNGARLLATSVESDFTLVELNSIPPGRTLLGWDATNPTLPSGTEVHRISHPAPFFDFLPTQYTRYAIKDQSDELQLCGTTPQGHDTDDLMKFHHMVFTQGGSWGGSSGAPSMLANGQVVGQLFAACGPQEETDSACSTGYDELDGNFFTTFDFIAPFLGAVNPPGEWLATPELPGFEFQVRITPPGSEPIIGRMESRCIAETFCASGALGGRTEVFARIIGPRPNGFLWMQINRLTPSKVEVWVRRVASEEVRYYLLRDGQAERDVIQDAMAFSP